MVTHYQRLLNYIVPDFVHVLVDGRIVRSGGPELALELEETGYASRRRRSGRYTRIGGRAGLQASVGREQTIEGLWPRHKKGRKIT